ncbi:MAG: hypothetical protein F4Y54_09990 [Dehalococcoidia bacterium]|nr:hypothetical protein [Dehalococcoidia bacterium]
MSRLSLEEERELIAEMEALRDADEDIDQADSWTFPPGTEHRAVLRVNLPFEAIDRLYKAAEADGITMGEAIVKMLDGLDSKNHVEDEAPAVTARRKKSAKAS